MDTHIEYIEIHPAIGITRVGNSENAFFYAPEVPYNLPNNTNTYKDEYNHVARQVQRFRLYGYNKEDEVVREIIPTDNDVEVEWQVHVANKKASWYMFNTAMDIEGAVPAKQRNPTYKGSDRKKLEIDPGRKCIPGKSSNTTEPVKLIGKIFEQDVYLGELRTDEKGNLVVFPGRGSHGYILGPEIPISDFANNDGWFDDISDGPVTATVKIGGVPINKVKPAWVVAAPPNFAPEIVSPKPMYDVVYDILRSTRKPKVEEPVSFRKHILPLLKQLSNAQWVNLGFFFAYGFDSPYDFEYDENLLKKLTHGGKTEDHAQYSELRSHVHNAFRTHDNGHNRHLWGPIYGDSVGENNKDLYLSVTPTQAELLHEWKIGNFINDYNEAPDERPFDKLTLKEKPEALTKAALHYCMGGPFHPGCELPWILRLPSMYADGELRFTLNLSESPDLGDELPPVITDSYPYAAQGPGEITRWMAVPWLTDTASCRHGYETKFSYYLESFWPSRVPNQVLSERHFNIIDDPTQSKEAKIAAFHKREWWLRGISIVEGGYTNDYWEQLRNMVKSWYKLGVVVKKPIQHPVDYLPKEFYVESGFAFEEPKAKLLLRAGVETMMPVETPSDAQIAATNQAMFTAWRNRLAELKKQHNNK